MNNHGTCLAAVEGFGQVYDCGGCGNIHVQVGPVSITLEPRAYMQLVAMISTSAANFELWLEHQRGEQERVPHIEASRAEATPVETKYETGDPERPEASGAI